MKSTSTERFSFVFFCGSFLLKDKDISHHYIMPYYMQKNTTRRNGHAEYNNHNIRDKKSGMKPEKV